MNLELALQKFFGYSNFRQGQKTIIEDLLNGQDVLAMLPTGAGKSICFQLPAFILNGVTIVVSPLLSLMEDQVQQLKSQGHKQVVALNRFLTPVEREKVLSNIENYKLIYVSPEILQSNEILHYLKKCHVSLFVVDEAHCISQWGHEFRTDYLKLPQVRKLLGMPPSLAITATASQEIQNDIVKSLEFKKYQSHIYSVDRPNISLNIEKLTTQEEKLERLFYLTEKLEGPGIIYTPTRKWAEELVLRLRNQGMNDIAYYHGGMENEDRILIQQQFLNDQLQIICCTNAFGMGVNKSNIRFVIHFAPPLQIEAYLQEIGRAGRDGKSSCAYLLTSQEDVYQSEIIQQEFPSNEQIDFIFSYLQNYESNKKISEEQLIQISGINEIMWRFLRFQLEQLNLVKNQKVTFNGDAKREMGSIKTYIEKRIKYKLRKFNQFQQWLNQDSTCRRQLLLLQFGEKLKVRPNDCCDVCGVDLETYYSHNDQFQRVKSPFIWQEELKKIFHQ